MEGGPAVCCQDPRTELVERVAAIDVTCLEEPDSGPEPVRTGVAPPPRPRAASVIPGNTSRPLPARPSLSTRKFSLQERPAGSCLEARAGPYATGPASHISPRTWRRPTIESHHVAISDAEVGDTHNREDPLLSHVVWAPQPASLVLIPSELGCSLPNRGALPIPTGAPLDPAIVAPILIPKFFLEV